MLSLAAIRRVPIGMDAPLLESRRVLCAMLWRKWLQRLVTVSNLTVGLRGGGAQGRSRKGGAPIACESVGSTGRTTVPGAGISRCGDEAVRPQHRRGDARRLVPIGGSLDGPGSGPGSGPYLRAG